MPKFLFSLFAVLFSVPAFAADDVREGTNSSCILEITGWDEYFFCGNQAFSCAGRSNQNRDATWSVHGEKIEVHDTTYWCCNGSVTDTGRYVQASNWIKESKIVTIPVGGGTCNYTKKINVCGEEESVPCTSPDKCAEGMVKRNGECVIPCDAADGNSAYESVASNNCVECVTTKNQGVNKSGICIKCNTTTQFWDVTKKECIEKNTLGQVSDEVLGKCWRCNTNNSFKSCVSVFSLPTTQRTGHPAYGSVVKDCLIQG